MQVTEKHREQARQEQAQSKKSMSAASIARIRAQAEHERVNAEADTRFVKQFNGRTWNVEQLMGVFVSKFGGCIVNPDTNESRIAPDPCNPRRRAMKALHFLSKGYVVHRIHDLVLFGELSRGEDLIPVWKFLVKYPLPEDETGQPQTGVAVSGKRCRLGSKCLHVKRRQAAFVITGGSYCSKVCLGKSQIPDLKAGEVVILAQRLCGSQRGVWTA